MYISIIKDNTTEYILYLLKRKLGIITQINHYRNKSYKQLATTYVKEKNSKIRKSIKAVAKRRKEYKEEDFPLNQFYTYINKSYKQLVIMYVKEKNCITRSNIKAAAKRRKEYKKEDFPNAYNISSP